MLDVVESRLDDLEVRIAALEDREARRQAAWAECVESLDARDRAKGSLNIAEPTLDSAKPLGQSVLSGE